MPFRDLAHRQDAIDNRAQPSFFDVMEDLPKLGEATHRRAENRQQFEEDEPQVERNLGAGSGAADDEAAAFRKRAQRLLERLPADMLEHHIDAALAGER